MLQHNIADIDILKIDIEGSELEVFNTSQKSGYQK